jgi:hypothetical protein
MRPPHREREDNEVEDSEEGKADDEGRRFGGEGGEDKVVEMEVGEEEMVE